jgi:predicted metalloprotease with PDZ domain
LAIREIGEKVVMSVRRQGKVIELPFKLEAPPEIPPRDTTILQNRSPLSGAKVENLSPAVASEIGVDESEVGVIVIGIERGSWASRIGLRPGDVVLAVNGRKIDAVEDLKGITGRSHQRWKVEIRRGNKTLRVEVG